MIFVDQNYYYLKDLFNKHLEPCKSKYLTLLKILISSLSKEQEIIKLQNLAVSAKNDEQDYHLFV